MPPIELSNAPPPPRGEQWTGQLPSAVEPEIDCALARSAAEGAPTHSTRAESYDFPGPASLKTTRSDNLGHPGGQGSSSTSLNPDGFYISSSYLHGIIRGYRQVVQVSDRERGS
jgi:hypothetical protein